MRVVIATPLYPPDVAELASYVKEFAVRLRNTHDITVVLYGRLPEEVERVRFVSVDKRHLLVIRLIMYTYALWKASRAADVLYVQNGPSVELPAIAVSFLSRTPIIFHIGDAASRAHAAASSFFGAIQRLMMRRARTVVDDSSALEPLKHPEVLPFRKNHPEQFTRYEQSWNEHIRMLERILRHD